jgi:PAS domain S-box-containing protein
VTSLPVDGGEMGERIRAFDWSTTSVGPLQNWPSSLRTAVDLMLGAAHPTYVAWGPQLNSLYNDSFIPIVGTKHESALGKPYSELWAEVWEQFKPVVAATMAGKAQYFIDQPVALLGRPGSHTISYFTFSYTPLRDDHGEVKGFYCSATETTQKVIAETEMRKRILSAMKRAERRYETLFNSIDEGFCIAKVQFDDADRAVDLQIVEVNPAFEQQTGIRDASGKWARELQPKIEQRWFDTYGKVARTGESTRFVDYSEAMQRWFDVYAFRIGEVDEPLVAILFTDITEKREVEERWRSAFQIKTVGVMFWSQEFGLTDMNEAFLRMTGFTREEALGKTWQELTPPEFHEPSRRAVYEVLTYGENTPYVKQYFRKDGSRWWGLFAARKVGQDIVEFALDVTEQRKAEESLRIADRKKDEFLATLAHELRNPLAPIRNGLQIARLMTRSEPTVQRTVEMMDRQLSHLVRLVDDLLDVGRITSGKLELRRQPLSLAQVVASSVESTRTVIENQRHELLVEPSDDELYVLGDIDRLSQVFINLLSNAAKYTEPGGTIRVTLERENEEAVVRVIDTGIGIPQGEAENVFELFSQVRSHQGRTGGGLGIGLSLVKSLVTMHGGRVQAASGGPGTGSTFTVRLPLLLSADSQLHASSLDVTTALGTTRRILVADDNVDAARSLAMLLELMGHNVRTANDGVEAVEQTTSFEPDVVFLDLGMPRMDGIEAAKKIRDLPFGTDTMLIALTGWGQENDRRKTLEAGFDLHVVKPVQATQLEAILAQERRTRH